MTICIFIALWEKKARFTNFFSGFTQATDNGSVCGKKEVTSGEWGGYFSGMVSFRLNLLLVLTGEHN